MSNTFTVTNHEGEILTGFAQRKKGRKTVREATSQAAIFKGPNAFKDATRCASYHGGAIVVAETPLDPSGEDRWEVDSAGSHWPIDEDGNRIE